MEKTRENRSADMPEGDETVLVVEDNDLVLELVVEMMKDLGYHVLTAIDAHSALWIIQHDDRIQLLFTDVMMPDQMNGIDLARAARLCRPEIKVLLTSGYAGFDAEWDAWRARVSGPAQAISARRARTPRSRGARRSLGGPHGGSVRSSSMAVAASRRSLDDAPNSMR